MTGYQPEPIHTASDLVEREVAALYRVHPAAATCLLYCGRGTIADKADMASQALHSPIKRSTLRNLVQTAQMYLRGVFHEQTV